MLKILLFCLLPHTQEPVRVDQIEINHVYNDCGELWLQQVLFWRWEPRIGGWACEGWCRVDQGQLRPTPRGWRWEEPGRCDVEAPQLRRSWTQYDREAANRDEWPVKFRRIR